MLEKIKSRIEAEISGYFRNLDKEYRLNGASALLFGNIKDFVSRKGKRVRPVLFVLGYLGFRGKPSAGLYKSAVSFELLHDFLLVHDDIIDKSATRRGEPSMHEMFNKLLRGKHDAKFNGQDLAIATGDVMFALSLLCFLCVKENRRNKERSLKKFCEAAMYTGTGEAIELLCGLKDLDKISKNDIYKIYDFKTAYYTFSYPLACGAALAGAGDSQVKRLFGFGTYLGRAFQIKDDILGMFSEQKETGKSSLTDLQESKKTLLVWQAFRNSSQKGKLAIKRILSKERVNRQELLKMRQIVTDTKALDYAKKEVSFFIKKARRLADSCAMREDYKKILDSYCREILKL